MKKPNPNNRFHRLPKGVTIKRKNWFYRSFVCEHESTNVVEWTDGTYGPGWMSDAYETTYCTRCGKYMRTVKTY